LVVLLGVLVTLSCGWDIDEVVEVEAAFSQADSINEISRSILINTALLFLIGFPID
jgi:hypothetical protein